MLLSSSSILEKNSWNILDLILIIALEHYLINEVFFCLHQASNFIIFINVVFVVPFLLHSFITNRKLIQQLMIKNHLLGNLGHK